MTLAEKVMAFVFCDAKIILINYLQNDGTVIGEYYANLLRQLQRNQSGLEC